MTTLVKEEETPILLWIEAETKYMFQKYRLWPSFIGAKVNDEKLTKGVLPVVIWNEQKKFLLDQNALKDNHIIIPGINDNMLSKKRKLDDINNDIDNNIDNNNNNIDNNNDDDDEDIMQPIKKNKIESNSNNNTFVNGIVIGLLQPFQWFSKYFFKQDNNNNNNTNNNKDTITSTTIWRDLHNMSYFVGPGDVYGGDYSIYRGGDPSNSHSTATVRIVRQRKISARDLLSFSRVQNQVAKSAVLAYINPDNNNKPEYIVVNFKNVSDRM